METEKTTNKKLGRALAAVLAALLVALLLLAVTGFAFIDVLKGPVDVNSASELEEGSYISMDIAMSIDVFAEEFVPSSGKVIGRYIVVPMGEKFVAVLLPERYFESEEVIRDLTRDYLMTGRVQSLKNYILVTGTVQSLNDKEKTIMYDWAESNGDWVASFGIVEQREYFADSLSDYVIRVDYIGNMSDIWVYILSAMAWLLLLFAVFVVTLFPLGIFNKKPGAETADAGTGPEPEAENTDTEAGTESEAETEGEAELEAEAVEETDNAPEPEAEAAEEIELEAEAGEVISAVIEPKIEGNSDGEE